MNESLLIWPIMAQVILTIAVFIVLAVRKAKAVKSGEVDRNRAALDNKAWSDDVVKVSNNIGNQFQTPVLFYVVCFSLILINAVSTMSLVLAWGFVISRYCHAYVHINSNYIPHRFALFLAGCISLIGLTGLVLWELAIL